MLQSKALAIATSAQFGPLASAFKRIWARRTFWAETRHILTSRFSISHHKLLLYGPTLLDWAQNDPVRPEMLPEIRSVTEH